MRIREIIIELTRPPTSEKAGDILSNAGYSPLGSGMFSTVWARQGDAFVLKLFSTRDTGYLSFVELAQNNPNQHFPVFRGKPVRVTDQYYGVRIERLASISHKARPLIKQCQLYAGALSLLDHYRNLTGVERLRGMNEQLKVIRSFRTQQPSLAEAIDLIHQRIMQPNPDLAVPDIHIGNVKMRGSVLVLFDPVGTGSTTDDPEADLSEGPTHEDLENIEHDKAVKRRPDIRKKRFVAMPGIPNHPALAK